MEIPDHRSAPFGSVVNSSKCRELGDFCVWNWNKPSDRSELKMTMDGRQQVLHVRGDSDAELETLFKSVLSPKPELKASNQVPMRMRKLPDSFFKEPQRRGAHSRESSADSTNYGQTGSALSPSSGLPIAHSHSHSSPAVLQDMHALNVQQLSHHHLRQQSYDVAAANNTDPEELPIPPGWEVATTATGQRYFLE